MKLTKINKIQAKLTKVDKYKFQIDLNFTKNETKKLVISLNDQFIDSIVC